MVLGVVIIRIGGFVTIYWPMGRETKGFEDVVTILGGRGLKVDCGCEVLGVAGILVYDDG